MGTNPMMGVLLRSWDRDTQGKAETGGMWPQTENAGSHQKLQEARKAPPLWLPEGKTDSGDTLIPDCLPPEYETINSGCFKPSGLWSFAAVAPGH